jgi:hypothetical protein
MDPFRLFIKASHLIIGYLITLTQFYENWSPDSIDPFRFFYESWSHNKSHLHFINYYFFVNHSGLVIKKHFPILCFFTNLP